MMNIEEIGTLSAKITQKDGIEPDHGAAASDTDESPGENNDISLNQDPKGSQQDSSVFPDKDQEKKQFSSPGWHTDHDELAYLAACTRYGTLASGYFLRNMQEKTLDMKHCVLGNIRLKPILSSLGGNTNITTLNLSGASLGDEAVSDLCNMFKDNFTIRDVNLSENQFSSKYAENICDALASSTQLERIDLHGNRFCDKSAIYFSELMATSLRMSYLNLSYNDFGNISTMLFGRALPQATSLVELDLSWNRLGTGGMRQFAKGLAENKNIEILNLSFNGIGPSRGCRDLAMALKNNKNLLVLDLSGNRISPEGAVLLSKGFHNNTTLSKLYLSRNPLQTAGCYAILQGIMKNANCGLIELELRAVLVNDDFRQLQDTARIKRPQLTIRAGKWTMEKTRAISSKWLQKEVTPSEIIKRIGLITNETLADALRHLDTSGERRITREAFIQEIYKYLSKIGIEFTEEQMKQLMLELDPDTEEEIDFTAFETKIGRSHQSTRQSD